MKKSLVLVFIITISAHIVAEDVIITQQARSSVAQSESLKGKIASKQRELEASIQSLPGAAELINQWKKLDQQIQSLEDTNGITPLIQKLNKFHEKACRVQRTNPQSREILRKIGNVRNEIDHSTKSEQQKINALYQEIEDTNDQSKQKSVGSQMEQYQKIIQSKSKNSLKQLEALNQELRSLPEIQEIIDSAREVSKEIRAAATKIKSQVTRLEKSKTEITDKLSQLIAQSELADKIYDAQDAWANLKRNLARQDPCLPDVARPSYLQYLN